MNNVSSYNELCMKLKGRWRKNVPMKDYTTMKVGGPADLLVHPCNVEELSMIIGWLKERNLYYLILGAGSNIIVRDGGIRGVVISLRDSFNYFRVYDEKIVAGAGTGLATLSAVALRSQLTGLEFASGIPASLGGAIKMNAGAFDQSINNVLNEIKVMDSSGNLSLYNSGEIPDKYREICVNESDTVVEAELILKPAPQKTITENIRKYAEWRKLHQPSNVSSSGCIFKNPPAMHAGKIIDELGLKGIKYGNAMISTVHGNFIVNLGSATTKDIMSLVARIQETVYREKNIELVPEVIFVGEESDA